MIHKTRGIVLHYIKYGENSIIVYIYTEEFGRQAYIINGVRKKNSRHKLNLFRPFSILDLDVYIKSKRGLQRIKDARHCTHLLSIPFDHHKTAITIFLAEILYKVLKEEAPDKPLFAFLINSIKEFDLTEEKFNNFHLGFLIMLTKYLGFAPGDNYSDISRFFSLRSGTFTSIPMNQNDYLDEELSGIFNEMLQRNYSEIFSMPITYQQRKALLHAIFKFYQIHIHSLQDFKSYDVVREIFA
jgi:DNA repair protein RecO (recombination protein O)